MYNPSLRLLEKQHRYLHEVVNISILKGSLRQISERSVAKNALRYLREVKVLKDECSPHLRRLPKRWDGHLSMRRKLDVRPENFTK